MFYKSVTNHTNLNSSVRVLLVVESKAKNKTLTLKTIERIT
ncbi:hypothetical protein SOJ_09360 [Staphylococcus sp. OJ82]|nr:hypothetical protein AOB58_2452 [Staphylococcus sp. AntiMn-1]EJX18758.1 hypothetical protein SOJ_09360 [Staphylococcus sp. OJ82]